MLRSEIRRPFVPSPTLSLRLPKNLGHCQPSHQSLKFSSDTTCPENWAKLGQRCTELNELYGLPCRHNLIWQTTFHCVSTCSFSHFLAFQKLFSLKALLDTNQVNAADSYLKEPNAVSIDPLRIPGTGTSLTQETPNL